MRAMRRRVFENDVAHWAARFLDALHRLSAGTAFTAQGTCLSAFG
jgi:trehalose-6-phosphate synthase